MGGDAQLFGGNNEKEELSIIEQLLCNEKRLLDIIEREQSLVWYLTHKNEPSKAAALTAQYSLINSSNKIKSKMAQTITVLGSQNTVPGQIVPVAADNVTVEPISSIQAGSEAYVVVDQSTGTTSLVATVAAVAGGAEGQFAVTRIGTQSGTVLVSYTALAADGVTSITNVGGVPDTIIFQGQPTGVAAALTAQYGTASAKK
jgi:hypothetical protein